MKVSVPYVERFGTVENSLRKTRIVYKGPRIIYNKNVEQITVLLLRNHIRIGDETIISSI